MAIVYVDLCVCKLIVSRVILAIDFGLDCQMARQQSKTLFHTRNISVSASGGVNQCQYILLQSELFFIVAWLHLRSVGKCYI